MSWSLELRYVFQHKLTNRKRVSVVKTAIHKTVDKTVKNSTKSQNIINDDEIRPELGETIKYCSLIDNKTDMSDSIGIKNDNKPEIDLVGVD